MIHGTASAGQSNNPPIHMQTRQEKTRTESSATSNNTSLIRGWVKHAATAGDADSQGGHKNDSPRRNITFGACGLAGWLEWRAARRSFWPISRSQQTFCDEPPVPGPGRPGTPEPRLPTIVLGPGQGLGCALAARAQFNVQQTRDCLL